MASRGRLLGILGIPRGVVLRLRVIAYIEGAIFLALLLAAAAIQPVWLAATVLVVGMFSSGFAWFLVLRRRRGGRPLTAHKVPKA